jgi:hypothetical protein
MPGRMSLILNGKILEMGITMPTNLYGIPAKKQIAL